MYLEISYLEDLNVEPLQYTYMYTVTVFLHHKSLPIDHVIKNR